MADRDDNVYKAKLAEQAERYDGEHQSFSFFFFFSFSNPYAFKNVLL